MKSSAVTRVSGGRDAGEPNKTPPKSETSVDADLPGTPERSGQEGALDGGAQVGRYVVLYRHGRGGMGHVYAAYDPELDRKVAIKLLRRSHARGPRRKDARARMLREAQALARLSHPNVVAIHDVGLHDGRVFVAMDFIEGLTLRRWVTSKPRGWRKVVRVFVEAGRGLAAAHAAGLVHRDFKPENVIVGPDDRAQVLDFGLARTHTTSESGVMRDSDDDPLDDGPLDLSGVSLDAPLTKEGAVLGTPAYMAPEQHEGGAVDARTDQFAFCLALYEALYGEAAFAGENADALKTSVTAGRIREPPRGSVPTWLRRVLVRGLSVDPAQRYPSMSGLLNALTRDPNVRRRRAVYLAGGVAGLGAFAYLGAQAVVERSQRCAGGDELLQGTWDPGRKATIGAAFEATGKPYAPAVWKSTEAIVDQYADAWLQMRVAACEATWVKGEQSEDALYLRMGCLQRRLDELIALTRVFENADATVVERAVQAVHGLAAVEGCEDVAALSSRVPTPDDPADRVAVTDLRTRLAQAKARAEAGKYVDGLILAESAADDAKGIGFRPIEAEALVAVGTLQARAGNPGKAARALQDAVIAAEAGGHLEAAAEAWIEMLDVAQVKPDLLARSAEVERHARALVEHLGHGDRLEARLLYNLGNLRGTQGRYDDAASHHRTALEIRERVFGDEHPVVGESLRGLGYALDALGRYAEALELHRRARALLEGLLGADHPAVASTLTGIALSYENLGQNERAQPLLRRAVAVFEAAHGPDHPLVATAVNNWAGVLYEHQDYEQALAKFGRALEIWQRAYGGNHQDVAMTLGNLGLVLDGLKRYDDALEHHRRSLEITQRVFGADHPELAVPLGNLGDLYRFLDRHEEALEHHRRGAHLLESALGPTHPRLADALEAIGEDHEAVGAFGLALSEYQRVATIRHETLGDKHPKFADALTRLGAARTGLDDPIRAREQFEQAVAIYAESGKGLPSHAYEPAEARFGLARIIVGEDGQAARAVELAQSARRAFADDDLNAEEVAAVDAWLREHRVP